MRVDFPMRIDLNKPAAESCSFVYVYVTFLLPPDIKGLKSYFYHPITAVPQLQWLI